MEKGEKRKREKSKKGWTNRKEGKMMKEKVVVPWCVYAFMHFRSFGRVQKIRKNVESKSETEKGLSRNKKWRFLGWFFREKNVKREKGLTRNSRKSSKIKGSVTHTFSKKKKTREQKKKKRKIDRKRKNRRCLLQFVGKKHNIFQIHQKQESNKWETECLKEEKENNQGELRQKRETISQETEKQYKAGKINVKHVQQKKETDKIVFGNRRKQKKKVKETIQDQEKRKIKNSEKVKETRKHGETERTSG